MLSRRQFILALAVGACAPPLYAQKTVQSIHRVEINNFAFEPSRVEVHVGDIVEWNNRDLAPHTATADNDSWSTGLLKNGATNRLVMTQPGEHTYHCAYHPNMRAVVVVVK